MLGGLSGQFIPGLSWPQLLRMPHDSAQNPERLRRVCEKIVQGESVNDRRGIREVRVHLEAIEVADHQQRRVIEGLPVLEELVVGGG